MLVHVTVVVLGEAMSDVSSFAGCLKWFTYLYSNPYTALTLTPEVLKKTAWEFQNIHAIAQRQDPHLKSTLQKSQEVSEPYKAVSQTLLNGTLTFF